MATAIIRPALHIAIPPHTDTPLITDLTGFATERSNEVVLPTALHSAEEERPD